MTAHAAVGIHDDLATGQTAVALGSADDEASGRVDQEFRLRSQQLFRQNFLNDLLDDELLDLCVFDTGGMLGRDDNVGDGHGFAVLVNNRDLTLGVGAQPVDGAALAQAGEFAAQMMGEHDRSRHEFRGFIRGVAEHQPLVARALLGGLFALGPLRIHALRDVGALGGEVVVDENVVGVKNVVVIDIANLAHGLADDGVVIETRPGRDLATDDHDVALHERLAGHPAEFVLSQTGVQNGVGNRVANFVRVSFTYGFGGKNVSAWHGIDSYINILRCIYRLDAKVCQIR